jgi:hypothetical protein
MFFMPLQGRTKIVVKRSCGLAIALFCEGLFELLERSKIVLKSSEIVVTEIVVTDGTITASNVSCYLNRIFSSII